MHYKTVVDACKLTWLFSMQYNDVLRTLTLQEYLIEMRL